MSLAHGLVRVAAALLPREQRAIRLEEWSADLAHCEELGITPGQVALGALQAGLVDGLGWRTPLGRSRWLAIGSIVVTLSVLSVPVWVVAAFMTTQLQGVITTEVRADGTVREVHWKDYPGRVQHGPDGYDELDPAMLLAAPSAEAAWTAAAELLTEIEAALTAEFGLTWATDPSGTAWEYHEHPMANGYGGQSLLVTLNSPDSRSTSVPAGWPAQQRAIEVIAEVTARHGYGAPVLAFDRPWFSPEDAAAWGGASPETAAIVSGVLEDESGQWVSFSIEDPSRGKLSEDARAGLTPGISLMWGATRLPEGDRDEFAERLSAFVAYERPEPFVSD